MNNSGLDGKGESRCTVLVKRPEIVVGAYMKNQKGLGDDAVYNITATIAFCGRFVYVECGRLYFA